MTRANARQRFMSDSLQAITTRLVHYVVLAVGVAVALEVVGIGLGKLVAAGAVVAVALGFAMQNITQNFVSGLILIIERTIKPGDVLWVEGQAVRVTEMGIRSTVARTRDDEEMIIPNSLLVQATVKNLTLRDSMFRVKCTVGVHYGSDLDLVLDVLAAAAREQPWGERGKDPVLLLTAFASSSIDFEVSVWSADPWAARTHASQLNLTIWRRLKEAGVTIAFPQLDLHVDPPVEQSLRLLAGREG